MLIACGLLELYLNFKSPSSSAILYVWYQAIFNPSQLTTVGGQKVTHKVTHSGWNVQQKWISLGTSGKHLYMYGIKLFLILKRS